MYCNTSINFECNVRITHASFSPVNITCIHTHITCIHTHITCIHTHIACIHITCIHTRYAYYKCVRLSRSSPLSFILSFLLARPLVCLLSLCLLLWLIFGSKLQVCFAKEPYKRVYILLSLSLGRQLFVLHLHVPIPIISRIQCIGWLR